MGLIQEPKNPLDKENQEVFGYGVVVGFALAAVIFLFAPIILPKGTPATEQSTQASCEAPWWGFGLYVKCD